MPLHHRNRSEFKSHLEQNFISEEAVQPAYRKLVVQLRACMGYSAAVKAEKLSNIPGCWCDIKFQ